MESKQKKFIVDCSLLRYDITMKCFRFLFSICFLAIFRFIQIVSEQQWSQQVFQGFKILKHKCKRIPGFQWFNENQLKTFVENVCLNISFYFKNLHFSFTICLLFTKYIYLASFMFWLRLLFTLLRVLVNIYFNVHNFVYKMEIYYKKKYIWSKKKSIKHRIIIFCFDRRAVRLKLKIFKFKKRIDNNNNNKKWYLTIQKIR